MNLFGLLEILFVLAIIAACAYLISFTVFAILKLKKYKYAKRWGIITFVLSFFIIIGFICRWVILHFH